MKIEEFLLGWIDLQREIGELEAAASKLGEGEQRQSILNNAIGREEECWKLLGQLAPDQLPLLAAQLMLEPAALSRIGWGRLESIDFQTAGLGWTTARAMLEVLLAPDKLLHNCGRRYVDAARGGPLLQDLADRLAELGKPEVRPDEFTFEKCREMFQITASGPVRVLNRTAIFQTQTGYVAFKIQKGLPRVSEEARKSKQQIFGLSEEVAPKVVTNVSLVPHVGYETLDPEPITELLRERIILDVLVKRHAELGLCSTLPTPKGVYVIQGLPLGAADPQGQKIPLRDPDRDDKSIYLWNEDVVIAYVYTTPSLDYFTYLHDRTLDDHKFVEARDAGFHDLYCLMRHGLFPTALADLFHARVAAGNIEGNRFEDGMGRYRVLNDLLDVRDPTRSVKGPGSGKLGTWMAAIEYVNLRGSGIADFADFRTLDDCILDSNFRKEFFRQLAGKLSYQSRIMVNLLAEPLLVYELVMARRYVEQGRMRHSDATYDGCLGNEMLDGLALALSAYTGCPRPLAKFLFASTLDAGRLGAQMSFFLSTSHAEVFETRDVDKQRALPAVLAPLYEPGSRIGVKLGELLTGVLRGAGAERVVHRCLRVGTGSGFSDDWKDPDLGPFSGPNPCKETERSRFVFAALALLVREAIEASKELRRQSDEALGGDRPEAIARLRDAVAHWPFDPSAVGELMGLLADDKDAAAQVKAEARKRDDIMEDRMARLDPLRPLPPPTGVDRNPRTKLALIQQIVQQAHRDAAGSLPALEAARAERNAEKAVELLQEVLAIDPFEQAYADGLVEALEALHRVTESQAVWGKVAKMQDEFLAQRMPPTT